MKSGLSNIISIYELNSTHIESNGNKFGANLENLKSHKSKKYWLHLDNSIAGLDSFLKENYDDLDETIINALTEEETRPRIVKINDGYLILLRGVNLNDNSSPEDMISLRIWIDKNKIVTVRNHKLKAISEIQDQISKGQSFKSTGEILAKIAGEIFNKMSPIIANMDDTIDDLEEQLIDSYDANFRKEINKIRRQAIMLKRYISPQREVLSYLKNIEDNIFSQKDKRSFQESFDKTLRFIESLDEIRERGQIIKDEVTNIISDKLNNNLYKLAIISAIFLPLGFLTGLFGINIGGMPGTESSDAFTIFSIILLALILVQIYLFKKLKWF
jgi:zinc transporter